VACRARYLSAHHTWQTRLLNVSSARHWYTRAFPGKNQYISLLSNLILSEGVALAIPGSAVECSTWPYHNITFSLYTCITSASTLLARRAVRRSVPACGSIVTSLGVSRRVGRSWRRRTPTTAPRVRGQTRGCWRWLLPALVSCVGAVEHCTRNLRIRGFEPQWIRGFEP